MCRPGTDPHLAADSVSVVVTDLSLVIGLSVAITVFLCVTSVAVRVIRSKRTSHSVYNMADMCKFVIFLLLTFRVYGSDNFVFINVHGILFNIN